MGPRDGFIRRHHVNTYQKYCEFYHLDSKTKDWMAAWLLWQTCCAWQTAKADYNSETMQVKQELERVRAERDMWKAQAQAAGASCQQLAISAVKATERVEQAEEEREQSKELAVQVECLRGLVLEQGTHPGGKAAGPPGSGTKAPL
ncbi:hypothetical protein KIL84_012767 [Mauremys mutica]|uniref:Uncharacterized protein n=1 Tax=Mauremys mutica TaxID=74926 RepID=A0A9D3XRL1_9SAUR|nr:hypothetical protein KIL84_012767 [Mauremys mutica]